MYQETSTNVYKMYKNNCKINDQITFWTVAAKYYCILMWNNYERDHTREDPNEWDSCGPKTASDRV